MGALETRLVALTPHGLTGRWLALGAALVVIVLTMNALRGEARWSRRLTLFGLRLGVLVGALVLFFEPALRTERVSHIPNHVAVLVDRSASMAIHDQPSAESRAERVAAFWQRSSVELERLRQTSKIDLYDYSDGLAATTEAELATAAPPTGRASQLGEALLALRARYEARDLAAVVVISDGADNGRLRTAPHTVDADERELLRHLDVPIHTVGVADDDLDDIAVAEVRTDSFAFVRTPLAIDVTVRITGAPRRHWVGQTLPVTLRRDGEIVKLVDLLIDDKTEQYPIKFSFTPERVGKSVYEVSVPVLDGEAVRENNSRAFVLNVIRDRIRALQVCGRPSYDERFLRGLLKHDPNVDLISFFILRTPNDIDIVSPEEMSLIPFPTDELFREQLRSFDVVFLQNFDYAPYGIGIYLDEIRRYVEEGGGLAMIGGDLSFSSGGYDGTPVADVLPVELLPHTAPSLIDPAHFVPQLTDEGKRHPLTALELDIASNIARWAKLPELYGTNLVGPALRDAVVLATHPTLKTSDGKALPVLAVREPGKGRSLSMTSDGTWRWAFGSLDDSLGTARAYQRFWQNAIRWLIRDPALSFLHVRTDKPEYERDEAIHLDVKAVGADYKPLANLAVTLRVRAVAGVPANAKPRFETTVNTDEAGELHETLGALPPGGYRVTASALLASRTVEESEIFLVRGAGRELENPRGDDAFLRAVADATGGHFQRSSDGALANVAAHPPRLIRVAEQEDRAIWNNALVFALTILCLAGEWLLRRLWGFV